MTASRKPVPPLDSASLERLALRYVEKFATTRAKLASYLNRKLRERGFEGEGVDVEALVTRFSELGYVNDRFYAEAKASAMARRGLGARRVEMALQQAGVQAEDRAELEEEIAARAEQSAMDFARRRRIGPFAHEVADAKLLSKQVAAMVRAGHGPELSWRIAKMHSDNAEFFLEDE